MWSNHLGDFPDPSLSEPSGTVNLFNTSLTSPPSGVASTTDNLVSLAANVVDMLHPYKTGVPVNVGIDAQTQSFLMMGGILIAGLVVLNMVGKRK